MSEFKRSEENPILVPNPEIEWEAAFNGCPVLSGKQVHLVYRAISSPLIMLGTQMNISTIGHALSNDGLHFKSHEQFIKPEND